MENNKLMLIYGFEEDEKRTIEKLVEEHDLPELKVVEKNMGKMKVADILDGLRIDVLNEDMPNEKVVIFNNFSDREMETSIKQIRHRFQPSPILAAVTPTSMKWTFDYLLNHLIEERNWFMRNER